MRPLDKFKWKDYNEHKRKLRDKIEGKNWNFWDKIENIPNLDGVSCNLPIEKTLCSNLSWLV